MCMVALGVIQQYNINTKTAIFYLKKTKVFKKKYKISRT